MKIIRKLITATLFASKRVGGLLNLSINVLESFHKVGIRATYQLILKVLYSGNTNGMSSKFQNQEIVDDTTHFWLKEELEFAVAASKGLRNQSWNKRKGTHVFQVIPTQEHRRVFELIKLCQELQITDLFFLQSTDFGGANKVAKNLAKSITRVDPQKKPAIIVTGRFEQEGKHLQIEFGFPVLYLNRNDSVLSNAELERAIYILCTSINSLERQYCFNSEEYASVLVKHSKLLALNSKIYFAIFCEDKNSWGRDISFGARYHSKLLSKVDGFISDNAQYLHRISKGTPDSLAAAKWIVLHQPIDSEFGNKTPDEGDGPVVWAGRSSHQKNWKLLIKIAKAMPEQQFLAFGVGTDRVMSKLENASKNLTVIGAYSNAHEVLVYKPKCLMYTSKWDGIPNVLIEFGALGIPIVSSTAGSISELLGEGYERALLVKKYRSSKAYVKALRILLSDPEQTAQRVLRLQRHLDRAHSVIQFDKRVKLELLEAPREQNS